MDNFISSGDTLCDVIKAGPLKKVRTNKKKFFVLRRASGLGPARLEYYDNEKRFSKPGAVPKRIVKLRDCWNVCSRTDAKSKAKTAIVIHTKEDSLVLVADENEHESWMNELKDLHDTEFVKNPGLLGPKYDSVWNVQIKPTGLGAEGRYVGKYRLCLSPTHLYLIRLDLETPDLSFPLNTVRRCGHNDSHFVMGVGRSAQTGEGDFAMQVDDSATSQEMHGVILAAMRANKLTEASATSSSSSSTVTGGSGRTRSRSHQYKKTGARLTLTSGTAVDLAPMSRPRTKSESTKTNPYASPLRRSPRPVSSMMGRSSVIGSSVTSSPFSSSSSIDHGFRIRSDSSGSRATTTSEEDGVSGHSMDHSTDDGYYLDMSCGPQSEQDCTPGGDDKNYLTMESASRHSSQSLEAVTEDSGYMEMFSGGSTSSGKQEGPLLVGLAGDDCPIHAPLDGDWTIVGDRDDYILHSSYDHATIVGDRDDYVLHSSDRPVVEWTESMAGFIPRPIGGAVTTQGDYMAMGLGHSLATVQERSGDSRILLESNTDSGFGIVFPSPDDDSLSVRPTLPWTDDQLDFPKRAYSVGSRPERLRPRNKTRVNDARTLTAEADKNDVKSSSAPHLTVEQRRLTSPSISSHGSSSYGSCSPGSSRSSRRGSRDDPELFMEVSFDGSRLGSDSFRPRTSSWGQAQAQAYRPRAHSHASKLKHEKTQISHTRSSSHELVKNGVQGFPGSSESLTKIHYVSSGSHHYMEISPLVTESGTKEIHDLATSVEEMTLQYKEITGPVGIVTRTSTTRDTTLPRTRTSHHRVTSRPPRPIRSEEATDGDTYVIGEPLNVKQNGSDLIPRMVDVWTPNIKPGDEDEDEYMCLNSSS